MTCPACGYGTGPGQRYCGQCGADLAPAVASYQVQPPGPDPAWPQPVAYPGYPAEPVSAPPPAYPANPAWTGRDPEPADGGSGWGPQSGASRRLLAVTVDALFCAAVLAAGLGLAVAVAAARGAGGASAVTARLGWVHLILALALIGVYLLGATWLGGRTLGRIWVDRLGGRRPDRGRRSPVPMLIPVLVMATVLGIMVGATVPVAAGTHQRGRLRTADDTPAAPGVADGPAQRRRQATAVDELLRSSTDSRTSLRTALAAADACRDAGGAPVALRTVADERQTQLDRAGTLAVDALPNGGQIREHLTTALRHSVAADRAFAVWAQKVADGTCGHDGNYRTALDESQLAQNAKRLFCQVWNPVAVQAGLPTRTEDEV